MIKLIAYDILNQVITTKSIDRARYTTKVLRLFQARVSKRYGAMVAVKVIR